MVGRNLLSSLFVEASFASSFSNPIWLLGEVGMRVELRVLSWQSVIMKFEHKNEEELTVFLVLIFETMVAN